jgi:serine/threonine protein kinase
VYKQIRKYTFVRIYRDIKGGNVLVDTGTVKLADFGASTKIAFGETQSTSTIKGIYINVYVYVFICMYVSMLNVCIYVYMDICVFFLY